MMGSTCLCLFDIFVPFCLLSWPNIQYQDIFTYIHSLNRLTTLSEASTSPKCQPPDSMTQVLSIILPPLTAEKIEPGYQPSECRCGLRPYLPPSGASSQGWNGRANYYRDITYACSPVADTDTDVPRHIGDGFGGVLCKKPEATVLRARASARWGGNKYHYHTCHPEQANNSGRYDISKLSQEVPPSFSGETVLYVRRKYMSSSET